MDMYALRNVYMYLYNDNPQDTVCAAPKVFMSHNQPKLIPRVYLQRQTEDNITAKQPGHQCVRRCP